MTQGQNVTIFQLATITTTPVAGDRFVMWQTSASQTVQVTASQVSSSVHGQTATSILLASGATIYSTAANFTLGGGTALATNATAGFVMVPSCAGVPSGAPIGFGVGNVPIVVDTTNFRIYAYMASGAWKMAQLA